MVVVLIDIHDLTTTPESTTIRAFTVARFQNRNTVLQESGLHIQCATTHICCAWRNGTPILLPFRAWEHADYTLVQLQERTAYGPIVDLSNAPQGNEVEALSAGTEEAPSMDETAQDGTEEALSADETAQDGTEEAPSEDETAQNPHDAENPDQDFLVVIRRPRINHPTDQFLVYVGDKEAEKAAAQARRQWHLGPFEPHRNRERYLSRCTTHAKCNYASSQIWAARLPSSFSCPTHF